MDMPAPKIATIAALEREVRGLVRHWTRTEREYQGRRFRFFEKGSETLVCGGIGPEAARRATEAVIALYRPELVQSVGFAGALDPSLKVGQIFIPSRVIDASDGSSAETNTGNGVLLSFGSIAGVEQKKKLAQHYGAQAVDMEAAAVARGAQTHGIAFRAVKAISDAADFEMPEMDRFVGYDGQMHTVKLVASWGLRPWLWPKVIALAKNSAAASRALCRELDQNRHYPAHAEKLENAGSDVHPINRV
jgi:adenosylhomocysteine nucleosidase